MDDVGWLSAGRAVNFVERYPGENTRPPVETEAFITYDDNNLYVAFVCKDNPDDIRATMCQRDQFQGDDAVGLLIDTFGEATWAYHFYVNPYGIQNDRMWTNVQGEDSGFDVIWHSAAEITKTGYTVEMAIPFARLRFPSNVGIAGKLISGGSIPGRVTASIPGRPTTGTSSASRASGVRSKASPEFSRARAWKSCRPLSVTSQAR